MGPTPAAGDHTGHPKVSVSLHTKDRLTRQFSRNAHDGFACSGQIDPGVPFSAFTCQGIDSLSAA
jgi:hypothetical protein